MQVLVWKEDPIRQNEEINEKKIAIRIKLRKGQNGAICVTELMDHVVVEGNRLFAHTPYKDTW